MLCRGIRGATTAARNSREVIIEATKELLLKMVKDNDVSLRDIAGIWFTSTHDLNATFPATAIHELGWPQLPVMCSHEMDVPGSLPRCIRILMLVNTEKPDESINHIFINEAEKLQHTHYGAQNNEANK
ncbi:MAG TPA: chorismate mutase [Dehalococcoidia bacterium]|nr:chorismate mutase [Dehalococcoidia bacterium]